jgi:hypothetical protein
MNEKLKEKCERYKDEDEKTWFRKTWIDGEALLLTYKQWDQRKGKVTNSFWDSSLLDYVLNGSFPQVCADVAYFRRICQYLDRLLLPIHDLGIEHFVHFLHTFSFVLLCLIHELAHEALSNLTKHHTNITQCSTLTNSCSEKCLLSTDYCLLPTAPSHRTRLCFAWRDFQEAQRLILLDNMIT